MIAVQNTSSDGNLSPEVPVSVIGDKKNAILLQAVASKGSEIELNPAKVETTLPLPCRVLVHGWISENMHGRVLEMAEAKEQTNSTDYSEIDT